MNRSELLPAKLAALAGVAAAVLLFLSVAVYSAPHQVSDQELTAWWANNSHQRDVIISTFMSLIGGLSLLAFITHLRGRIAEREGGAAIANLAFGAGLLFIAMLFAGDAPRGAVAFSVRMRDEPLPGVDTLRYLPEMAYLSVGLFGGFAVALMTGAASWAAFRLSAFPRWLGWIGAVATAGIAVLAVLVGAFYLPVLFVWVLAASVAIWRGERAPGQAGLELRKA